MAQRFDSLLAERPEKRYQEFLQTVARRGAVWTLASDVGYTTMETEDGQVLLVIFPTEKYANQFSEGDFPEAIEVEEFMTRCREAAGDTGFGFMVFPNGRDAHIVDTLTLLKDLQDAILENK